MIETTTDALRGVFLQEAEEGLATMEQALLALEAAPDSREPLNETGSWGLSSAAFGTAGAWARPTPPVASASATRVFPVTGSCRMRTSTSRA